MNSQQVCVTVLVSNIFLVSVYISISVVHCSHDLCTQLARISSLTLRPVI